MSDFGNYARLVELERRASSIQGEIQRQANALARLSQNIKIIANTVPALPPSGGGGGGSVSLHRFPESFTVRVTWDTAPTLITGASSNPTADTTSLADAVAAMVAGLVCSITNYNTGGTYCVWDETTSQMIQVWGPHQYNESGTEFLLSRITIGRYADGDFKADPKFNAPSVAGVQHYAIGSQTASVASNSNILQLSRRWSRRNGIGSVIGNGTVLAGRTVASSDSFGAGPTYGETGSWSFPMECPASSYHNAGSGTIYLEW